MNPDLAALRVHVTVSVEVFQAVTLVRKRAGGIHHGQESLTPPKAEYIGADQTVISIFRLQFCGGPYIPIIVVIGQLARRCPYIRKVCNSRGSQQVKEELRVAQQLAKPIAPILMDDCELPAWLSAVQYIDWRTGQDQVYSDNFGAIREMVVRLRKHKSEGKETGIVP
jgi:hypothetical protein